MLAVLGLALPLTLAAGQSGCGDEGGPVSTACDVCDEAARRDDCEDSVVLCEKQMISDALLEQCIATAVGLICAEPVDMTAD